MLTGPKRYFKSAIYNTVVRPLQASVARLAEQNDALTQQVNRLSRHFGLPVLRADRGDARFFDKLVWDKLFLIDYACQMMPVGCFADLGGAWCEYEGGYSFYTMERHGVPAGVLVDGYATDGLRNDVATHPGLRFVNESFASARVAEQVGRADVIYLFDVLYMQADPTWEQVLEMYAPRTRCFLVSNVQFNGLDRTVRLMDLGREEYFRYVPATRDARGYRELFDKLDEVHPDYGGRYRDCHHFWQWAMTDQDLIGKMRSLGFRMHYYRTMCRRTEIEKDAESRMFAFFHESLRIPCR
jgi:hypothetical protein